MSAWTAQSEAELDQVWDRVAAEFHFKPSVHPAEWPGFEPEKPFITWAIPDPWPAAATADLHERTLAAFRQVLPVGSRMYALDWQHPSFWFAPHAPVASWEKPDLRQRGLLPGEPARAEDQWLIPVLPNGDYSLFLGAELDWGWFGHPWEQTICVFGEPLLKAVLAQPPALFVSILRRG